MKLGDMFRKMIDIGRQSGWRNEADFERQLQERRREYDALTGPPRERFDTERLWNPFGDSRIAAGDEELDVRGMIVGIDCTLPSILHAERLRDRGRRIDAFLSHHGIPPAGTIYEDINNTHVQILTHFGVPEAEARRVVDDAIRSYHLRMSGEPPGFEQHTDMALFCVHNPMDNLMSLYVTQLIAREKPRTLRDVVELLLTIDEFAISGRAGIVPEIAVGDPEADPGTIYFDALGGICLNDEELTALLKAGQVQTVVRLTYGNCIRICREEGANLIFFPHNASDNLGINLMLDLASDGEDIDIVPTETFYRIPRPPMTDLTWPHEAGRS